MKRPNIEKSRFLRKHQTDAEKKIWSILKNRQLLGVKFRRQFPVENYILDFYTPEYSLGIEADGNQHYNIKKQYDQTRAKKLATKGIQILRFSNVEILKNIDGVCLVIKEVIERKKRENPLTQTLSPKGRGVE